MVSRLAVRYIKIMTKKRSSIGDDSQHWVELAQRLPECGVASIFPTDAECRDRLATVRWPAGVTCLKCASKDIGFLEARKTYHCRNCRYQFTVLTGTALHASKLSPQLWFDAAQEYVRWRAKVPGRDFGLQALEEYLGVAYATARKVRGILREDLSPEGAGLLASCICMEA